MTQKLGLVRKTVSFNLDNPDEKAMVQLVSSPNFNFSKLVKRYLAAELRARNISNQSVSNQQVSSHITAQSQQKTTT